MGHIVGRMDDAGALAGWWATHGREAAMRVAFQLQAKGRTLTFEFGKDEPQQQGEPAPDTAPAPMQVYVEPLGFRRLDDPLHFDD